MLLGVHSVREALRAGRPLDKILIAKGASGPRIQELIDLSKAAAIPVRFEQKDMLDRTAQGSPHQNVVAFGVSHTYADLSDVLDARLVVILDGVEDPHNLGAIVRTAHAAGAGAIIVPERRAAPLTETVDRASAGALEHMKIARVTNLSQSLERLKQHHFWVYGFDERGSEVYDQVEYNTPTAIVLGGEGRGVGQNVQKHCDALVRIPMSGAVASLNVSVAAGVVLFEWRRRTASVGTTIH